VIEPALVLAWDSRYVSEGRDNLDGAGLWSGAVETIWNNWLFGVWHAEASDLAYTELNLFLEHGIALGEFLEIYAGYTHLRFPDDNAIDNELGAGVLYTGLPWGLEAGVDWYHSFQADGSFVEASLFGGYEMASGLVLSPGAVLGFNGGYIADGHDGANHLALVLALDYPLTQSLEIGCHLSYNFALDSDPASFGDDELLRDFFHGGVALTWIW